MEDQKIKDTLESITSFIMENFSDKTRIEVIDQNSEFSEDNRVFQVKVFMKGRFLVKEQLLGTIYYDRTKSDSCLQAVYRPNAADEYENLFMEIINRLKSEKSLPFEEPKKAEEIKI